MSDRFGPAHILFSSLFRARGGGWKTLLASPFSLFLKTIGVYFPRKSNIPTTMEILFCCQNLFILQIKAFVCWFHQQNCSECEGHSGQSHLTRE